MPDFRSMGQRLFFTYCDKLGIWAWPSKLGKTRAYDKMVITLLKTTAAIS